ncbi:MAG: hypothetical protein ACRD8W_11545 [Nitrososphaeraceae archaeon]
MLVPNVYASSSSDNPTKSTDEQFKVAVESSDGIVMDNVKRSLQRLFEGLF